MAPLRSTRKHTSSSFRDFYARSGTDASSYNLVVVAFISNWWECDWQTWIWIVISIMSLLRTWCINGSDAGNDEIEFLIVAGGGGGG